MSDAQVAVLTPDQRRDLITRLEQPLSHVIDPLFLARVRRIRLSLMIGGSTAMIPWPGYLSVTLPENYVAHFPEAARAAQKSVDAAKDLADVPVERVLELATPDQLGIKLPTDLPMMLSFLDFRKIPIAGLWAETNPAANRPDGTDADYFAMKSLYPGVTSATIHRTNGVLALLSGRMDGQVFVSVLAYELGHPNSNDDLREGISRASSDFSLTASTGGRTGAQCELVTRH